MVICKNGEPKSLLLVGGGRGNEERTRELEK